MDTFIRISSLALELAGIGVIAFGALLASLSALFQYYRRKSVIDIYRGYRRQLSRGILLGLEFLIAADIIRTVAIEPTFKSVGLLAAIVVIRTFLSVTLQMEVTGKWPWEHATKESTPTLAEKDR
ncbi:MAG: DUF1622 domain-containing protein [Candidatus Latescibacterota bacterium]